MVDFQGARLLTLDGGLLLVREFDERLGPRRIDRRAPCRRGKNIHLPLTDLVRHSVCSRLAEYEHVNDAERLSQDPAFRLIGSSKIWERGVPVRRASTACWSPRLKPAIRPDVWCWIWNGQHRYSCLRAAGPERLQGTL